MRTETRLLFGPIAGFLAPPALAISCRRDHSARTLVVVSCVLVLGSIITSVSELYPQSQLWQLVKSVPGLVQRS